MAAFYLRLTALGLAAVATAIAEGSPLPLVDFALGDGGGATYDPTGAETDLVNEVARVPIETVARDPAQAHRVTVTAVVPAEEGGFWVRELGVFTEGGDLFAIGKYPEAYKPTIAEGASYDLQVAASMTIAAAADVTVSELSGDFYATRDWARANADFFAVISAGLTAPPAAPTAGDQYLIPAGAAGAWVGQAGKIAHWRGALEGWQFLAPRNGAQANVADANATLVKTAGEWVETDNPAAALFLHANCL
jgi:phage-related tail fiber protein